MKTITIPQKITKGEELIIISRKEYEGLLSFIKGRIELDRGIEKAVREVKTNKTIGPFEDIKGLVKSLEK